MITGWEWIVVLVIVAVLFLWGPKKLPEMVRSIGEARKEFAKASKGVAQPVSSTVTEPSSDDLLIETARKLGIATDGKTREQISQEIVEKSKASNQ